MVNKPYVFISYSSKEYNEAASVKNVLAENGINCWMAPQSIEGGSDYTKSIPDAIANCSALVLVCSRNAQDSYWVKSEVIEAISRQKPIVPFIIDNSQLNKEFNFMLSPAHRIDAYRNKARAYETLVVSLKNLIYPNSSPQAIPSAPTPTPSPIPAAQKVVAMKPKISQTATILCFVFFIIAIIASIVADTLGVYDVIPGGMYFFTPIMLIVTLINLAICRKHKSAPLTEINKCRSRHAISFILFLILMLLLEFLPLFSKYLTNHDAIMTIILITAIIEIVVSIIITVKFKSTRYIIQ